jgi:hypothetical protein
VAHRHAPAAPSSTICRLNWRRGRLRRRRSYYGAEELKVRPGRTGMGTSIISGFVLFCELNKVLGTRLQTLASNSASMWQFLIGLNQNCPGRASSGTQNFVLQVLRLKHLTRASYGTKNVFSSRMYYFRTS